MYRKKGFEVIGVACDKPEDEEKLTKFLKENRIAWPQYFDGKETKSEFGEKLNVRGLPVAYLFDQKGLLVGKTMKLDQIEGNVKRLLAIK